MSMSKHVLTTCLWLVILVLSTVINVTLVLYFIVSHAIKDFCYHLIINRAYALHHLQF